MTNWARTGPQEPRLTSARLGVCSYIVGEEEALVEVIAARGAHPLAVAHLVIQTDEAACEGLISTA